MKNMGSEQKTKITNLLKEIQQMRNEFDFADANEIIQNGEAFREMSKKVFKYVRHLYNLDARLPFQSQDGNHVKINVQWYNTWAPRDETRVESSPLLKYEICCTLYNCGIWLLRNANDYMINVLSIFPFIIFEGIQKSRREFQDLLEKRLGLIPSRNVVLRSGLSSIGRS
jgi:hypothetical protein